MHPVEVIRWVLGHPGADPVEVASEVAMALASMPGPVRTLSARRVVERRPADPILRWACSRVLCSLDPFDAAHEVSSLLWSDETPEEVASVLTGGASIVVLGADGAPVGVDSDYGLLPRRHRGVHADGLAIPDQVAVALADLRPDLAWPTDVADADLVVVEPVAAGAVGIVVTMAQSSVVEQHPDRVVLAVGRGRALPDAYLTELGRHDQLSLVSASAGALVVGPGGPVATGPAGLAALVDCPLAAELISN